MVGTKVSGPCSFLQLAKYIRNMEHLKEQVNQRVRRSGLRTLLHSAQVHVTRYAEELYFIHAYSNTMYFLKCSGTASVSFLVSNHFLLNSLSAYL